MKDTLFVITTSNTFQNEMNAGLLEQMHLPYHIITLCDNENGESIGSGGAFFNVLQSYYEKYKKIILINSGGYSKRVINYSVRGKIFARLKQNGEEKTLLTSILETAQKLSENFDKGILVCCSDILVQAKDIKMEFSENIGFCVPADLNTASRHGVMFADEKGHLKYYLHKQSPQALQEVAGGADSVLLDTGMAYFNKITADILYSYACQTDIVRVLKENGNQLCLYADVISLFSQHKDKALYLQNCEDRNLQALTARLYDLLVSARMQVCNLNERFIHFGTIRETIHNIHNLNHTNNVFHSFVSGESKIANSAVLDNVSLEGNCTVGENCLMSDVVLNNVCIPANTSVCGIKLRDGSFVCIVTSIFENPKDMQNGKELWEFPRFYKEFSFDKSYERFLGGVSEDAISIHSCLNQADYGFPVLLSKYIQTQIEQQRSGEYLNYRKEILAHHFETIEKYDFSRYAHEHVEVRLPVRINLAGTWTDAMPYCIDHGGKMVNMAVYCDEELPIRVCAEKIDLPVIEFVSGNAKEIFKPGIQNELSDFNLFYSVLAALGIQEVGQCESGFRLSVRIHGLDHGSGLGVSSIVMTGCFMALGALFGIVLTKEQISDYVFATEQLMGTGGGWQDQIGVLYPGIKLSVSAPGIVQRVTAEPLQPKENITHLIQQKSVLIPTGIEHFGKSIVGDVMERYLRADKECLQAFDSIRLLNDALAEAIRFDDAQKYCTCINKHADLLMHISHRTYTEHTEAIAKALQPYVQALTICGAGGGGYFYAVLKEEYTVDAFKKQFKQLFENIQSDVKQVALYQSEAYIRSDCAEEIH
ncbi:MAG: hypothetical protein IJG23_03570 [Clostridia bacterium]|nr:hypothetical protein [Clostridia bacterium]